MEIPAPRRRPRGFAAFAAIWSSQLVSILSSGMSGFALTIWMYERTGSATAMAATQVFYLVPFLVTTFFAGPLVDRCNRKLMMALSDICAAIGTAAILSGFLFGFMDIWMVYAANVLMGVGNAFQWPAFSSTVSLMVPKEQLGRVNGMMSLMDAGPDVFAPILAGVLLPVLGIKGILAIDIVTFFLALGALLAVDLPAAGGSRDAEAATKAAGGNIFKEAAWGFSYIFKRPSLLGLQLLFLACNLCYGIGIAVGNPMILARSGASSMTLAGTRTAAAIGGVAGGLLMSAWGGFRKRTWGIALGWLVSGLAGGLAFGLGRGFWPWAIATAIASAMPAIVNGSNQAIWQSKVPAGVQGKVFTARRLIAWISTPITPLVAGPLADFVLEPAMRDSTSGFARLFSPLFGSGPGSGMAFLVAASGLAVVVAIAVSWSFPAVRRVEELIPDADNFAAGPAAAPAQAPAQAPAREAGSDAGKGAAAAE
jgi:MFS family permease